MATRTKRKWKPDSRGYYTRQIGWVLSKNGKQQQQKFLLGKDRRKAEIRERKLRELWDRYAANRQEDQPRWPDDLLGIAKLIARGVEEIAIQPGPRENQLQYATRIQRLQATHPVALFVPSDRYMYDVGCAAANCLDQIPVSASVAFEMSQQSAKTNAPRPVIGNAMPAEDTHLRQNRFPAIESRSFGMIQAPVTPLASAPTPISQLPAGPAAAESSASLHDALSTYEKFIRREFYRPEMEQLTGWGNTQVRQIRSLKEHHENRLLRLINADEVNEMIGYWRRRPMKKATNEPMKPKSAGNYLSAMIRFFKWLHNSSSFDWSKPYAFSDVDTRIKTFASDLDNKQLEQVETFSLHELKLLMKYAQPLDRLLILLGLNCGFGRAEIATVLVKEVYLFEAHSAWHCELLNYQSTNQDSFIKRIRRKNSVYGEHILYPLTVQGIQWALEERKKQPGFSDNARLLLNKNGKPYDHPTKSGNANQTIPNRLARLIKRIQDDGNEIRSLSFGKLRKTAGQLVKTYSDGEIMGVFDCHGNPVKTDSLSDVYSNRPFGRVFKAIRDVEQYLEPVFKQAGPTPFKRQSEAYTKRSTIDRIIELHEAGFPTGQIANAVAMSGSAVSRHVSDHLGQKRAP